MEWIEVTFKQMGILGRGANEGTAKSSILRDREGRAGKPERGQLRNEESLRISIL